MSILIISKWHGTLAKSILLKSTVSHFIDASGHRLSVARIKTRASSLQRRLNNFNKLGIKQAIAYCVND